jgi:hypothetical protein
VAGAEVIGLVARHRWRAHIKDCVDHACPEAAYIATHDAYELSKTAGWIGGFGVATAAVGALIWLTTPSDESTTIAPSVGANDVGVAVLRRF